jgi:EF hand domain-containing protein
MKDSLPGGTHLLASVLTAGAIAISGATLAAADAPAKTAVPAAAVDDAKPIPPSRSELPDSAFKKLDGAHKGYITRDDTKELEGFDAVFQQNDGNHDGRLTPDEFKRAWSTYAVKP